MGTLKRASDPSLVVGATERIGDTSMSCGVASTIVTFRPQDDYQGDFGFDWMRNGDWSQPQETVQGNPSHVPVKDNYKKLIVHAQDVSPILSDSKRREQAYLKLGQEYRRIPINLSRNYHMSPQPEVTMATSLSADYLDESYYTHWLSLFPADLATRINAEINHPAQGALRSSATLVMRIQ